MVAITSEPDATIPAPGAAPPSTVAVTTVPVPTLADEVSGRWTVGRGSQARYHIDDTILGQTAEVVGSTSDVTGSMDVVGTTVQAATAVVNMQSVRCGCVHDSKYHDLLDTDVHPTSTFELTTPIDLARIPGEGEVIEVPVTGRFTIHGTTRSVSFTVSALREAGRVAVHGTIPVRLEDYNIENPSAGALGGLSNAFIELLIAFERA